MEENILEILENIIKSISDDIIPKSEREKISFKKNQIIKMPITTNATLIQKKNKRQKKRRRKIPLKHIHHHLFLRGYKNNIKRYNLRSFLTTLNFFQLIFLL